MIRVSSHRRIPLSTRIVILFGGFKNQFGWAFFGFGLIFFWAFAMESDLSFVYNGELITTEGKAIRWQATDAAEGGVSVFENYFKFLAEDGNEYEGSSFATGLKVQNGETLIIEYPEGKPEYARIKDMRRKMFGPVVIWVVLFPFIGLIFIMFGLRRSIRALRLFKYGILTKGVLVSKERTNTKINGSYVYKLTFRYKADDGMEYLRKEKSPLPHLLEDEGEERLLYLRSKPSYAIMVDSLPSSYLLTTDDRINPAPMRNVIFLSILPMTTIIGHGIYLVNTYLS